MKYLILLVCVTLFVSCTRDPKNPQAEIVLAKESKLIDSLAELHRTPNLNWLPGPKDVDMMTNRMTLYTKEIIAINDTAKVKPNQEQLQANVEFIKKIRIYQDMVDFSRP